jgi:5-methylcytosine-specific restriction protein A
MNFYKSNRWRRKRERILRRDEYLCRECKRYGKSTSAVTVHHVHPLEQYPELALVNDNLISLCNQCHEQMHDRVTSKLTDKGRSWMDRPSPLSFN